MVTREVSDCYLEVHARGVTGGTVRPMEMYRSLKGGQWNDMYIVDIDGTIANIGHRLHHIQGDVKNWDKFYESMIEDFPIVYTIQLLRCLREPLVYITGRPERYRKLTIQWFSMYQVPLGGLLMRKDGDRRPDYVVKEELLTENLDSHAVVHGVFEDRQQCVDMWRKKGFIVYQVADGRY